MDSLAPAVVAVVVAHDPGPWFTETLESLAAQDYSELSILILDAAGTEELAPRVAPVLPSAFVRRLDDNQGFGAAANQVRTMVDGADYYLFCHDDVALAADAVHILVEEAFRSNAGIVTPKVVAWDDPDRLIHVGLTADKGGSVEERVLPAEIDHGQHDAVRDVFVAPGGCTLIRADLFDTLGGYDPLVVAMGEDLDLSWRAQVAGARILVVPDAVVRHREELASGGRPLDPALVATEEQLAGGDATATPDRPVTLQELQRRHELLAVLTCYRRLHLMRVVPQVALLALGEVVVAQLAGNRARVRAVVGAWRWNVRHRAALRQRRMRLDAIRRISDKEVRTLQVRGSARLSGYFRRVFQVGFHGVHDDELARSDELAAASDLAVGPATVEEATSDSVAAGEPAERLSLRSQLLFWLVAAAIVAIGSRGVLTGRLPIVGQFVPFPSWSSTWAQFFTGWHPSGVGTTAPATPALALSGLVGTVLLGAMGLTQKVLIFGCLPLGVWGVCRLVRPFASPRASLVAGLAYLAVPVPYDALALGRWGALVSYAGAPWVLVALLRATRLDPFSAPRPETTSAGRGAWASRHGRVGDALTLGLLVAVLMSFCPAMVIVVVAMALALWAPTVVLGEGAGVLRALRLALASLVVAGLVCLPWALGVLSAGRGLLAVFGVPSPSWQAPQWSSLLHFAVGPIGDSPLTWGFVVAAVVPLVMARGPRFRWAARLWSVALTLWMLAWITGRGWAGPLAIDPLVLLAPAAASLAGAIGLGVAAFEVDLRRAEFGLRQLVSAVGVAALAVASLPTIGSALPGRWDLPVYDFAQSVAWMRTQVGSGAFRVLWIGDARSLAMGSWSASNGLAYATSENGAPDARWLWNAADPGPASSLGDAVDQARTGRTNRIGALLAPAAVRYVVVLNTVAPVISGEQQPTSFPVPADLLPALDQQLDLHQVLSGTGMTVFANAAWIPIRAQVSGPAVVADPPIATAPTSPVVLGAHPVLPGPDAARSYRGPVRAGTVLAAVAPSGSWNLVSAPGSPDDRLVSPGWDARFRVASSGIATLRFDGGIVPFGSGLWSVVAWSLVVAALVDRRRIGRRFEQATRSRGRHQARQHERQRVLDDEAAWSDEGIPS